jgi:Zn-dependent peptidase ImmA (M78 family)
MTQSPTRQTKLRTTARKEYAPSPVAILRSMMPNRPLRFAEACRLAELQASRLLALAGITDGPVPDSVITELPRITVRRAGNLISSGASAWSRGLWQIRLNAGEPLTRQRFTLAHELKHVLDASHEDVIYSHLPAGPARERHIEAVCDHFAASLLMPRAWVKQRWYRGTQDVTALAWIFNVSQQAMLIRLQALGLVEPLPRCTTWQRLGSVAVQGSRRPRRTYRRSSLILQRTYARTAQFHLHLPVLEGAQL